MPAIFTGPFECQTSSVFETPPPTNRSGVGCTDGPSIHETVRMALIGDAVPLPRWTPKANKPIVVEVSVNNNLVLLQMMGVGKSWGANSKPFDDGKVEVY